MIRTLRPLCLLGTAFCLYTFPLAANGQSRNDAGNVPSVVTDRPAKAAPGTYQYLIKGQKKTYAFTSETLRYIESKRQPDQEVRVQLRPEVEVRILPRSVINHPKFKPLEDRVFLP